MPEERTPDAMNEAPARDWLFALLRYAVTRDDADQAAVLAIAEAIDARGSRAASTSFDFFRRTTLELCRAIREPGNPGRSAIIRRHLDRIEDDRLRRAFAVAVELPDADSSGLRRPELWRGLA